MSEMSELFNVQYGLIDHLRAVDSDIPRDIPVDASTKDGQRALRAVGLKAVEELHEALRHFKNWKPHRRTDVPEFDREKFLEEMADTFAFMLEMLIFLGVSADEFVNAYMTKASIVHDRINSGY